MDIFQRYIDQQKGNYSNCLDQPDKDASIFVVIPCFNEPDILPTLNSLAGCYPARAKTAVLVVVNDAENAPSEAVAQNISTLNNIAQWKHDHPGIFFGVQRIYVHALPQKWAGVGWARKIGMDEAVKQIADQNLPDGIIISLDADSTVLPNYLQTIETAFSEKPLFNFFTIYFEHPFKSGELSRSLREGIIRYELHMRYYRNALEWSGYPHAIHTVGSSFALRGSAYVKQGGMNRRKAGEDFYFLHKLVLLGQYGNIGTTTVFPASRCSDRVPFGTGAAMKKWVEGGDELNYTYPLAAFDHLKPLFTDASRFYDMNTAGIHASIDCLDPILQSWCRHSNLVEEMVELKNNCSNAKVFEKRFFDLFNAFRILKYLNFVHQTTLVRATLNCEPGLLLQKIGIQADNNSSPESLLEIYREIDKKKGC